MKKLPLFIVLIAFVAAHLTQAQRPTDKGKWMLELFTSPYHGGYEGNSNFLSAGTVKTKYNSSSYTQNSDSHQLHFSPKVGYLLFDHLAAGIALEYHSSNVQYDSNLKRKRKSLWVGPFVRYYFLDFEKIYPFMEAGYQTGRSSEKHFLNKEVVKYSGSDLAFYGIIGVAFPISEKFLMNLSINNSLVKSEYLYDNSSYDYNSLFWQVGFTVSL